MTMSRHRRHKGGELGEGHREFMLLGLSAAGRPLSIHDFRHQLQRMSYHFGVPIFLVKREQAYLPDAELEEDFLFLVSHGYVTARNDGTYELSDQGREIAADMEAGMSRAASIAGRVLADSRIASIASICVNAVLAAIKLMGRASSSTALR